MQAAHSLSHVLPPARRLFVLQVLPLPDELLLQHSALYDEFKNETHWPKHVLVHYSFRNEGDIDFQQGLYVLTALGECYSERGLVRLSNSSKGRGGKMAAS
jgi:hypothetical protein